MFDISFSEMTIVVIIALIVLGPDRMPRAIRTIARWIHYLKQTSNDLKNRVESELQLDEVKKELQAETLMKDAESFKRQTAKTARSFEKISLKDKEKLASLMSNSRS